MGLDGASVVGWAVKRWLIVYYLKKAEPAEGVTAFISENNSRKAETGGDRWGVI